MKKYEVMGWGEVLCSRIVEAETEDEAKEIVLHEGFAIRDIVKLDYENQEEDSLMIDEIDD